MRCRPRQTPGRDVALPPGEHRPALIGLHGQVGGLGPVRTGSNQTSWPLESKIIGRPDRARIRRGKDIAPARERRVVVTATAAAEIGARTERLHIAGLADVRGSGTRATGFSLATVKR